jgi:hypothetical protein
VLHSQHSPTLVQNHVQKHNFHLEHVAIVSQSTIAPSQTEPTDANRKLCGFLIATGTLLTAPRKKIVYSHNPTHHLLTWKTPAALGKSFHAHRTFAVVKVHWEEQFPYQDENLKGLLSG